MTRRELPDGVPADNSSQTRFGDVETGVGGFEAPDMATPKFNQPKRTTSSLDSHARRVVRREVEIIEEDEDDDDDEKTGVNIIPPQVNNMAIMIAIAGLLAALGAIVISTNRQETPLCSSQPEWNQYNCRAG